LLKVKVKAWIKIKVIQLSKKTVNKQKQVKKNKNSTNSTTDKGENNSLYSLAAVIR
jgi:hypothetical protein